MRWHSPFLLNVRPTTKVRNLERGRDCAALPVSGSKVTNAPRLNRNPRGPPLTLGNMRGQGVRLAGLLRSTAPAAITPLSARTTTPTEIEVPSFALRMKYGKCGAGRVDVRPNWKEEARQVALTQKLAAPDNNLRRRGATGHSDVRLQNVRSVTQSPLTTRAIMTQ
jgi:hypothetical protein